MTLAWQPNPSDPEVFHITRVENLSSIMQTGLQSDARVASVAGSPVVIGDPSIKQRRQSWALRLPDRPVVGSFVPFYFCPRSVMLFMIARGIAGAHAGQNDVVHLVTRVSTLAGLGRRCVFTDANAATGYASASEDLSAIATTVDWTAQRATDWRDRQVKAARQAEFLVADHVPGSALEAVVVRDQGALLRVSAILAPFPSPPKVRIEPTWYY